MLLKGIDVFSRRILCHKAVIVNGVDILVAFCNLQEMIIQLHTKPYKLEPELDPF